MSRSNVKVEVLESHIAIWVPTDDSESVALVGDANQVLIDHLNGMVNQWLLVADIKVPGIVWLRKRSLPLQFFYCGPGVTSISIDQPTFHHLAISIRLPGTKMARRRLVGMLFTRGIYVRRFLGHTFYARRLLTINGTFTSSFWGVQHLESGLSLFECTDDCAAGALQRVEGSMYTREVTEAQLDKWVVSWLNDPMMAWDDYVPLMPKSFGKFDRIQRSVMKDRKS